MRRDDHLRLGEQSHLLGQRQFLRRHQLEPHRHEALQDFLLIEQPPRSRSGPRNQEPPRLSRPAGAVAKRSHEGDDHRRYLARNGRNPIGKNQLSFDPCVPRNFHPLRGRNTCKSQRLVVHPHLERRTQQRDARAERPPQCNLGQAFYEPVKIVVVDRGGQKKEVARHRLHGIQIHVHRPPLGSEGRQLLSLHVGESRHARERFLRSPGFRDDRVGGGSNDHRRRQTDGVRDGVDTECRHLIRRSESLKAGSPQLTHRTFDRRLSEPDRKRPASLGLGFQHCRQAAHIGDLSRRSATEDRFLVHFAYTSRRHRSSCPTNSAALSNAIDRKP